MNLKTCKLLPSDCQLKQLLRQYLENNDFEKRLGFLLSVVLVGWDHNVKVTQI